MGGLEALGAKEGEREARRPRGERAEGVGCAWGGCGYVLGRYKGVIYPSKTTARRRRAKKNRPNSGGEAAEIFHDLKPPLGFCSLV